MKKLSICLLLTVLLLLSVNANAYVSAVFSTNKKPFQLLQINSDGSEELLNKDYLLVEGTSIQTSSNTKAVVQIDDIEIAIGQMSKVELTNLQDNIVITIYKTGGLFTSKKLHITSDKYVQIECRTPKTDSTEHLFGTDFYIDASGYVKVISGEAELIDSRSATHLSKGDFGSASTGVITSSLEDHRTSNSSSRRRSPPPPPKDKGNVNRGPNPDPGRTDHNSDHGDRGPAKR